jgi:hypothetical protein
VLGASLRWCNLDKVKIPQMAGMKALDDCFATTEREVSKGYALTTLDWMNAASNRCAMAALQRAVEGSDGDAKKVGSGRAAAAPYSLAIVHLLRQKGDNKRLAADFKKMSSPKLVKFASEHTELMRSVLKGGGC